MGGTYGHCRGGGNVRAWDSDTVVVGGTYGIRTLSWGEERTGYVRTTAWDSDIVVVGGTYGVHDDSRIAGGRDLSYSFCPGFMGDGLHSLS